MINVINNVSIKSKIVNFLLIKSGYRKKYSSSETIKKVIDEVEFNNYSLPKKCGMTVDEYNSSKIALYNGSLTSLKNTIIFYLHGGSYIEEATKQQINFVNKIAKLTNSTVVMPLYKLAPSGNFDTFVNDYDQLYAKLIETNKKVIFIGDSAGGGLCLSYSMYLKSEKRFLPSLIILFSPWLDVSLSNPLIYDISNKDSLCMVEGNKYCGKIWANDIPLNDYRVSPLYGDFLGLPKIFMTAGSNDICCPDCELLAKKLDEISFDFVFYKYKKQSHNFEIFSTPEAKKVLSDVLCVIKEVK